MSDVKRVTVDGPDWELSEDARGEFVYYDDYAALEAERDRLVDLLDMVKSDLSAVMNWMDLDRIAVRIDAAIAAARKGEGK